MQKLGNHGAIETIKTCRIVDDIDTNKCSIF